MLHIVYPSWSRSLCKNCQFPWTLDLAAVWHCCTVTIKQALLGKNTLPRKDVKKNVEKLIYFKNPKSKFNLTLVAKCMMSRSVLLVLPFSDMEKEEVNFIMNISSRWQQASSQGPDIWRVHFPRQDTGTQRRSDQRQNSRTETKLQVSPCVSLSLPHHNQPSVL